MTTTLVLASASPARLAVLRAAGVQPVVRVSGVDEDALVAELGEAPPEAVVTALAQAKAADVVAALGADPLLHDAVVVGCDSMLHIGGTLVGKPGTTEVARQRWGAMAGGSGELLTGHSVLRVREGAVTSQATGVGRTVVRFADPSEAELQAYLATGEPLRVAGSFTLDGLGGWFVDGIDGDPSSVIGIGLPLLRGLLAEVGVAVHTLWAPAGA
ncbi:Maf family protein [Rhodococcus sp. X156]|uniref:Maf family protein n=1 Tax=Rhodococcus sp. X156 TaxID=2499145 RepID=UPI001F4A00ED|nr:Maf family protein [Rhodococcus sp. X156]